MKARAPGKLLLSGAYAVLEGAPAIVCAVDRHAVAHGHAMGDAPVPAEVRAALADPPNLDTSALCQDGRKLGLGSSAAGLVAALALRAAEEGRDVRDPGVREQLFARARSVHARVQGGGSGVDVAASVFGGVLRYRATGELERVELPSIRVTAFFSGRSARTSELRSRVDALRARDPSTYEHAMRPLIDLANAAVSAIAAADAHELVASLRATGSALAALGAAADAPIVLDSFAELAAEAIQENAAFLPSGAGGGDVGAFVGTQLPSASFVQKAQRLGMKQLDLGIDTEGVVTLSSS